MACQYGGSKGCGLPTAYRTWFRRDSSWFWKKLDACSQHGAAMRADYLDKTKRWS